MANNRPAKRRGLPLRKKLFLGTAGISIVLVLLVTFFAMRTTYDALHSQVIGIRHMSIGWLQ